MDLVLIDTKTVASSSFMEIDKFWNTFYTDVFPALGKEVQ